MQKKYKQSFFKFLGISCLVIFLSGFFSGCSSSVIQQDTEVPPLPVGDPENINPLDYSILAKNVFRNPELRFESIGLQQGLSNSTVTVGAQDARGVIWFGTYDGLNKFDGYQFSVFRHDAEDQFSISDNIIYDLYADQQGSLWIATDNGLNRLDINTQKFEQYFHRPYDPSSLSDNVINVIYPDQDGSLWIGTETGLNRFTPENGLAKQYINQNTGINLVLANVIYSLYQDGEGIVWVGTASGLYLFDPDTETFSEPSQKLKPLFTQSKLAVHTITSLKSGAIWIGTSQGVLAVSPDRLSVRSYTVRDLDRSSLSDTTVRTIYEDYYGLIWVGTNNGLNLYNPDRDQFIQFHRSDFDPNSLIHDMVNGIFQDKSGVIWFFTASGISALDVNTKQFLHYHKNPNDNNSLINNQVLAIHEDKDGFLWIGTISGLDRLDRRINHFRHFTADENTPDSLSNDFITSILEDSNGNIWIGTDSGGVNLYDPITESFKIYKHSPVTTNALSNDMVSTMLEDNDGNIWIGTARGMLDRLDPFTDRYIHVQLDAGDEVNQLKIRIRSMIEDDDGFIWLGTSYGLYRLNPSTLETKHYQQYPQIPESLSDDFILSVYQDKNGTIWVGTYGGGLNKFDSESETFKTYLQKDGLANDTVYGILEDGQGFLWLSTNHGLSKFSPLEESFVNFDVRDGLQSNEFNERAFFKSPSGEMFFGGVNGVTAFYPQQVSDNPFPPAVILTSLQVGGQIVTTGETVEAQQAITLKWPENYFEFSFAALNYKQPEDNQYAYILEGFDKSWNINGNLRFGRYTNLPGGSYILHLVAANEDGVWNLEGAKLVVTVIPPFWERPIFQWGLFFLLVFGAGGGYLLKLRSVEVRNRGLEKLVEERTEEIEQRRQVAEGLKDVLFLLNSNKSLEESLNFIVCAANRLTKADHVLLLGIRKDPVSYVTVSGSQKRESDGDCIEGFENSKEEINWLAGLAKKGKLLMVADLPVFIRNNSIDPVEELSLFKSMLVLPILSGTELMGSLFMLYQQYQQFENEELDLAQSFSDQAALAIGNAQLRDRVQQTAILAERNRLARDLHDAVTQTLFSASLISEALPSLYEENPNEGRNLLKELRQLSRGALAEMRTLLLELRPSALLESKLNDLMKQLAESAEGRSAIKVNLDVQQTKTLPEEVHISLYRISQEALNNVVKHAQATKVDLVLESRIDNNQNQHVTLTISDNGSGFNPDSVRKDHFGLGIIHERAKLIGANLKLESKKGYGTLIRVEWSGRSSDNG